MKIETRTLWREIIEKIVRHHMRTDSPERGIVDDVVEAIVRVYGNE
jgi:hypothetical protein